MIGFGWTTAKGKRQGRLAERWWRQATSGRRVLAVEEKKGKRPWTADGMRRDKAAGRRGGAWLHATMVQTVAVLAADGGYSWGWFLVTFRNIVRVFMNNDFSCF